MLDLLRRSDEEIFGRFEPQNLINHATPKTASIKVVETLKRLKDGGCFVKFSHPEGIKPQDVEGSLDK